MAFDIQLMAQKLCQVIESAGEWELKAWWFARPVEKILREVSLKNLTSFSIPRERPNQGDSVKELPYLSYGSLSQYVVLDLGSEES